MSARIQQVLACAGVPLDPLTRVGADEADRRSRTRRDGQCGSACAGLRPPADAVMIQKTSMKEHGSPEQTRLPRRRGQHAPGLMPLTKLPHASGSGREPAAIRSFVSTLSPTRSPSASAEAPNLRAGPRPGRANPAVPGGAWGTLAPMRSAPCATTLSALQNREISARQVEHEHGGDVVSGKLAGIRPVQIQIVLTAW